MKRNWGLMIGLALGLVITSLAGCSPNSAVLEGVEGISISNQQSGIWVTGQGKVSAAPDIATLRLGVEAESTSVAEAQTQAQNAMDRVMTALTGNGIAKKDIQTQYFSISRVTRWDQVKQQEIVTGYRVTNVVTAKIRDIDKTGSIIDAVAEAGGDLTRIDNVSFSVDDPTDYYREAREEAMADAKAKAEQLAGQAGVTLGKPTYISEGTQMPTPIYQAGAMFAERAAAPETPISPGELDITLNVQVAYDIR